MHYMIRKTLLAAATVLLCMGTAFPVLADEPVETNVTVIEATDNTPEPQQTATPKESKASHTSRTSKSSDDEYVNAGPGAQPKEDESPEPAESSLGRFTITGYCNCKKCSSGHGLTYSGTVPIPNHTISADLNVFPLGTKLKVDGIVYTVEDKGSSVNGNILDIFYSTHQEALAKGTYTAEVFLVEE